MVSLHEAKKYDNFQKPNYDISDWYLLIKIILNKRLRSQEIIEK